MHQVNSVNLLAYAEQLGLVLKKVGNSYKVKDYGGLYIDATGAKWNWFSKDTGGGPIQFVMEMEDKNWVDAVHTLLGTEKSVVIPRPKIIEENKGQFLLPDKNNTYKHVIAYLIRTRGIDKDVVYDFISQDKLYENDHSSCVFVGYDKKNEPKYASVRSTNTTGKSYRGDVKNSDKAFPFSYEGSSTTVCIFESPIDLMSYLTLLQYHGIESFEHHMISLGGVADRALDYYLKLHPEINRIMLCLDNDEAGHFACQQFNEKYHENYKLLRHSPTGKDFNEDLLSIKSTLQQSQVRESSICYETEWDIEEEMEL
ncbi:MAG: topoisomerase [Firmicutes bacterium HGW-Firmicutes-5]|nr:MAG: topoisomerase [Firmicutes bacterium HGW-Firmicutes-5]